ncbi:CRISPR-associated protein Csm5 [Persephonella hydrogeniphila]|uniref:CRISPR system Cms protein Csm5 n=1 Tax=Persephonella hydrogeniphila TaxID=198703 RepID=A0A285NJG6_9AQUI|nr:type III-A CRISPR-associated RAMP protein Csm5 [Persephonella hydrogeniphila]SNZ09097.1 CRISPR-associated protein Csm5 [Persephonella hydrogeniphila]
MKYQLIALSPIHIGNGNQISNWSYSVDNSKISIYNFEKVVSILKNDPRKLMNLTADIERNPLNKSLGDILKNYRLNVKPEYTVQLRGNIKKQRWDRNRRQNLTEYKQIWEFIKENGKVYIPGTEIKGAIRTALFYKILKDKSKEDQNLKDQFLREYEKCLHIKNYKDDRDKKKKIQSNFKRFSSRWENFVFRGDFNSTDAKRDILKILLVSDSNLKDPEDVLIVKDILALGVSRHFEEPHEIAKKESKFTIDIRIPFKKEYKQILPVTFSYLGMKKLREACSEFALSIIEAEIEYFYKTNELRPEEKSEILEILEKRKNLAKVSPERNWIILRLGKHQGFLSTTINLLVKELNPELYSKAYREIVPVARHTPNKSRKITIDNELLGWCILIPQE